MKKKIINGEIDLLELIFIMWEQKLKVILITVISLSILLISEVFFKKQVDYKILTKVNSISTFEGSKYSSYNNYIDKINSSNVVYYVTNKSNNEEKLITNDNIKLKEDFNDQLNFSGFKKITKLYLLNLYIEKINDPSFDLSNIIKKFSLNQNNNDENIEPIEKISYSIKVEKILGEINNMDAPSYYLILKTNNLETGKKLIFFLNDHINREIRSFLLKEFENEVLDVLKFQQYQIEDINFEMSNNSDNNTKVQELNKIRETILNNKKLERLENIFRDSPILKENEFIASNLMIRESEVKITNDEYHIIFKIIFTIIIGLLLSTIYLLILNSIKMRK